MNVKTLVFDLDGTLIDSRLDIADAIREALSAIGYPQIDIPLGLIGLSIRDIALRLLPGIADSELAEFVRGFRSSYDEREHARTTLYPRVVETLGVLSSWGKTLYVATMKPKKPTANILLSLRLSDRFSRVCCTDSWPGERLNKAAMIERLLREEGIAADSAAYVGDHPDDMRAAKQSGTMSIAALYGYGDKGPLSDCQPDLAIAEFGELPSRLMELADGKGI